MAQRTYRYPCCLPGGPAPVCSVHGGTGVFINWIASPGERTIQFIRIHGLAPRGEALALVPRLLEPLRRSCLACRGSGWLGREDDDAPVSCPGCDGLGGFWTEPMETVARVREEILRAQPEVAVRWEAAGGMAP